MIPHELYVFTLEDDGLSRIDIVRYPYIWYIESRVQVWRERVMEDPCEHSILIIILIAYEESNFFIYWRIGGIDIIKKAFFKIW